MSPPTGVGARLRSEREARGVGLEELSRATKIRKVLLEALEAERWEELPSRVFLVGYIRAVAGHLHLDADALIAELGRPQGPAPAAEAPAEVRGAEAPEPSGGAKGYLLVAGLLVLAVGGGGLWFLLRPSGEPPPMPAPARSAEPLATLAQTPVPPPVEEPTDPLQAVPTPGAAPAAAGPVTTGAPSPAPGPAGPSVQSLPPSMPETPAPGQPGAAAAPAPVEVPPPKAAAAAPATRPSGDLFLEVGGPCWMVLYRGGERVVYREVQAGERLSFDGPAFTLTVGDASVVRAFWKGRAVTLPGTPGSVVKEMRFGEVQDEPPGR